MAEEADRTTQDHVAASTQPAALFTPEQLVLIDHMTTVRQGAGRSRQQDQSPLPT
jgi:hypothetical protein